LSEVLAPQPVAGLGQGEVGQLCRRLGQVRHPRRSGPAGRSGGYARDIVFNAPLTEDHYFLVPKVVE
jgi:Asp-tRNA(Asn)/Glu-tRNA(Gln) amidotransferase C subunit